MPICVMPGPALITEREIRRRYPPWRIFQAGFSELYPVSNYFPVIARHYTGTVWDFDVVAVGTSVVLTGNRFTFGRPLPGKAVKIIRAARRYDGKFDPRRRNAAEKEEHLRAFASRFSSLLQDDFTDED